MLERTLERNSYIDIRHHYDVHLSMLRLCRDTLYPSFFRATRESRNQVQIAINQNSEGLREGRLVGQNNNIPVAGPSRTQALLNPRTLATTSANPSVIPTVGGPHPPSASDHSSWPPLPVRASHSSPYAHYERDMPDVVFTRDLWTRSSDLEEQPPLSPYQRSMHLSNTTHASDDAALLGNGPTTRITRRLACEPLSRVFQSSVSFATGILNRPTFLFIVAILCLYGYGLVLAILWLRGALVIEQ